MSLLPKFEVGIIIQVVIDGSHVINKFLVCIAFNKLVCVRIQVVLTSCLGLKFNSLRSVLVIGGKGRSSECVFE